MSNALPPSYLTCTAAQAQEFNERNPHNIESLNQLLEHRVISHPAMCVAGFPEHDRIEDRWNLLAFTYPSFLSASNSVALYYVDHSTMAPRVKENKTDRIIALLSPSCADLFVTLFAALRLSYGVLLLAPQNTAEAITHLCRATSASHIICHASLLEQGQKANTGSTEITLVPMASRSAWVYKTSEAALLKPRLNPADERDLTALVMHTSGSTGMPKPIYHSHRVWTEAIPCMPGEPAFSTTPLFHGGIADLLRSMNAVSTLYLFSSLYPITASNVIGALSICPGVRAFLSVPYILKMLAESADGLKMLQTMDLVSTGGAPLPEALGNDMVQQGVRLVSRLGSSECGFLMSSHRDYDSDKKWSWLRNHGLGLKLLHFESVSDSEDQNLYELVVDRKWSTRVVSNRPDGSFASGDLYAKHPSLPNTWRYHGRTDDIIVLMTGKKASASPLETALRACPVISEAIVFGAKRPALGVVVVPASSSTKKEDILEHVHFVNDSSASFARILDQLVIILDANMAAKMPKTSKGSVIRPKALHVFAELIDEAYWHLDDGDAEAKNDADWEVVVSDPAETDVTAYVRDAVTTDLQRQQHIRPNGGGIADICDEDDLFNAGIDSVQAVLIRSSLQKLVAHCGSTLSSNVVFEYPSIAKLSSHIQGIRSGVASQFASLSSDQAQYRLMRSLIEKYSFTLGMVPMRSTTRRLRPNPDEDSSVVITGATGSLGVQVMMTFLAKTDLRIFVLVRASDDSHALDRVLDNVRHRVDAKTFQELRDRMTALAVDLTDEHLGLRDDDYGQLLRKVVTIVHVAWPVNFALSLESFEPALKGLRNLILLACHSYREVRFIFSSSTSAAVNSSDSANVVYERLPEDESAAAPMGYARSKWVAEHLCQNAHETVLPGRIAVARIGQLCGDTQDGIWNESEAWPLLFATSRYTGCLPSLGSELSLLPFDLAAQTVYLLAEHDIERLLAVNQAHDRVPIIHVVNPNRLSWSQLLDDLAASGLQFERVSVADWMSRLKGLEAIGRLDAVTARLLRLWHKYVDDPRDDAEPTYDIVIAQSFSPYASGKLEISWAELVRKWVSSWRRSGFLPV